jgi:4-amino-4-deoxychorismate lyase
MILINGEEKTHIDFSDRGLQYGDGLFETIEVKNGHSVFLNQHLDRLAKGCQKLLIPFTTQFSVLKEEIETVISDQEHVVLKVLITRGGGGRGYQQPETIKPTRILALYPFPDFPVSFKTQGVKVRFCSSRLGLNPNLVGIKHLNRLEQVMARSEWVTSDYQEGLMLDINDNVIEGTMSNIFLIKDNCLYTPKLDQCGIQGIIRKIVFQVAADLQIKIVETRLQTQQCYEADELFLTNSIIGIWPIKQLQQQACKIGPITQRIMHWFEQYKDLDLCR